ncbi:MAG: hypothetical protein ACI9KK_001406 [Ascidiaceihabitans sp.]|jgi:hypothetical protein
MSKVDDPRKRILVGAASFADATAALRIIAQLPSNFCSGLGGVLVEDLDTLAVCQFPDQRVVLFSGIKTLAPSLSQVRSLLNADARAFQHSLARATDPSGTDWAFAQDKGELVSTSLRAAKGWDILVIGYHQIHNIKGKIILMTSPSATSNEMDVVSKNLSQQFAAGCVDFSVRSDVEGAVGTLSSNEVQFDTFDESLKALTRTNALAVLVDLARGPVRNRNDLARVLEAARCPLVVFGASGADLLLEHSTQIPPSPARNEHKNNA